MRAPPRRPGACELRWTRAEAFAELKEQRTSERRGTSSGASTRALEQCSSKMTWENVPCPHFGAKTRRAAASRRRRAGRAGAPARRSLWSIVGDGNDQLSRVRRRGAARRGRLARIVDRGTSACGSAWLERGEQAVGSDAIVVATAA